MVSSLCTPSRHSRALSMRPWEKVRGRKQSGDQMDPINTRYHDTLNFTLLSIVVVDPFMCFQAKGKARGAMDSNFFLLFSFFYFLFFFIIDLNLYTLFRHLCPYEPTVQRFIIYLFFYLWLGWVFFFPTFVAAKEKLLAPTFALKILLFLP